LRSSKYIVASVVALLSSAGAAQAADWPSGYSKCADQGGTCKVGSSPRSVSFGSKDQFVVKTLSGNIACTTATFGTDANAAASGGRQHGSGASDGLGQP